METTATQVWIGIDVSKATLDVCILAAEGKPQHGKFANEAAEFPKLLRWVRQSVAEAACHFCLEATGAYGRAISVFLVEVGQKVSVVNPARVKYSGMARGQGNKTDPHDALTIADFCRKENPPPWRAAEPEVQTLVALMRRLQDLKDQLRQEHNRQGEPGLLPAVQRSLEKSLHFLREEIATLEKDIDTHVREHPRLKADRERLKSIPGVSDTTAHWVLAELPDVAELASAEAAAAYAGLAPREHRSGTSVRKATKLSKAGNPQLRRALYMPALTAIRRNPCVRALYERLLAAGKSRLSALCAAMRKLLMLCYGVLKHQEEFDPDWHEKHKQKQQQKQQQNVLAAA